MSKISLFVSVGVAPENFDEFLTALKAHIAIIKNEPGCEFIEIYRENPGENPGESTLHLWEVWSDRPSWDDHMNNANSLAWRARMSGIVRSESIKVLDQL